MLRTTVALSAAAVRLSKFDNMSIENCMFHCDSIFLGNLSAKLNKDWTVIGACAELRPATLREIM